MQEFRAKIQVKIIIITTTTIIIIVIIVINNNFLNRFRMITAAILVCQNNELAAMLMHPKKYLGFKLLSQWSSRAQSARSGAPWVKKYGKLPIRENLVIM